MLLLDAGLTGQDGTDSLRPVNFTGCSSCTTASSQCSQPWHRVVLALLAHRPGICPPGFGAVADVHSPWQHLPASRAAPALLFHTHGQGLEALGLSPVVVPGAALAASSPLQGRSSSLPPVSSLVQNRPVPDCLFATSWHPAAAGTVPFCPATSEAPALSGCRGTAWVPCALPMMQLLCGPGPLAAQWGPALPLPVSLRLGPGLCPHLPLQTPRLWLACAHVKAPQRSPKVG